MTKAILNEFLGELLYDIRFRSMTIQEFTILLATYGDLFSSEQYQEIVQLVVQSNDCHTKFFNGPLRQKHDEDISIACNCKATPFYFQDIELIQFTVSKSILLCEVVCSEISIANKDKRLPAEMWIVEKSSGVIDFPRIVHRQKVTLKSQQMPIIPLENALVLRADALYEIEFKQCPASSQFFSKPFKTEVYTFNRHRYHCEIPNKHENERKN